MYAQLYTSPRKLFTRLTSELNSHLAIHEDQMQTSGTNFHACVHAQPLHLTYLSHIVTYQDEAFLNHHLLRWQPEAIVNLPEGIGVVPFYVPGSDELMTHTKERLRNSPPRHLGETRGCLPFGYFRQTSHRSDRIRGDCRAL